MNIAMTGATGYIGKHLSSYLTEKGGHRVIPLGRSMFREGMSGLLIQTLAHCDVVINLAGAPINKRWTPEYKQELFNSRIVVTHRIVRALNAVKTKPKLMISASAVGYYPPEVEADEYTRTRGEGFLSDLCYAWEKEAKRCPEPTRLVITRFGVVLSPDGGAMQQMLRPLQATKVATAIGPGTQSFPWIALHDLCRAMEFLSGMRRRKVCSIWLPRNRSRNTILLTKWVKPIRHGRRLLLRNVLSVSSMARRLRFSQPVRKSVPHVCWKPVSAFRSQRGTSFQRNRPYHRQDT